MVREPPINYRNCISSLGTRMTSLSSDSYTIISPRIDRVLKDCPCYLIRTICFCYQVNPRYYYGISIDLHTLLCLVNWIYVPRGMPCKLDLCATWNITTSVILLIFLYVLELSSFLAMQIFTKLQKIVHSINIGLLFSKPMLPLFLQLPDKTSQTQMDHI